MGRVKDLLGDEPIAWARRTDPSTSHKAAQYMSEDKRVTKSEQAVLDGIRACGGNATWDEIHRKTGIRHGTISPRFKPLVEKGKIEERRGVLGETIKRRGESGNDQTVWFLK